MKNITVGLFSAVIALQLAVPSSMLLKREMALQHGQEFRFRTAPVDPFDAFRGRYVALGVEASQGPVLPNENLAYQQKVYVIIAPDEAGFAKIVNVSAKKPMRGTYIIAKSSYQNGGQVNVQFPFDRYYMNEKKAPAAERLYWEHSQRGRVEDAYITVRVKDGFAVIAGLYINGEKIEDVLKKQMLKG